MSNKTQLQTNNAALDGYIARINAAKEVAAGLPEAGGGGSAQPKQCNLIVHTEGTALEDAIITYPYMWANSSGSVYYEMTGAFLVELGGSDFEASDAIQYSTVAIYSSNPNLYVDVIQGGECLPTVTCNIDGTMFVVHVYIKDDCEITIVSYE